MSVLCEQYYWLQVLWHTQIKKAKNSAKNQKIAKKEAKNSIFKSETPEFINQITLANILK